MLYFTVLYFIGLYCIVLCCIALYCVVLYCILLYFVVLYCISNRPKIPQSVMIVDELMFSLMSAKESLVQPLLRTLPLLAGYVRGGLKEV